MKRRVNFTGRIKIMHNSVYITVQSAGTLDVAFSCSVNLAAYSFPNISRVFVEVYRRGFLKKRFEMGTVGSVREIVNMKIPEFWNFPSLNFRVIVTGPMAGFKTILGKSSAISLPSGGDTEGISQLLLSKKISTIKEVWKLDFETGKPVLLLNSNIPGIESWFKENPFFRHSVLPALLREILYKLYIVPVYDPDDQLEEEKERWMKFIVENLEASEEAKTLSSEYLDENSIPECITAIDSIAEIFSEKFFRIEAEEEER